MESSGSSKVTKAKGYIGEVMAKGCSQLVCKVLNIDYKTTANFTYDSESVGSNNSYSGLSPGDIVGWRNGSSGHVAIYVGEENCMFIDCNGPGAAVRKVKNGYGKQKLYRVYP